MKKETIDVSIVIVCMNNLKNLYPCLESIRKYTTEVTYETFVVAYLFTKENLEKVKTNFPWVTIVESNEIRGFSENNNLALKQAKGRYCFVLNDDTEMQMSVIDRLVAALNDLPENVAIISPRLIGYDGITQVCGRPYKDWRHILLGMFHLYDEKSDKKYSNKTGTFQSYNIIGAAFLIKTKVLVEAGYFDEYFFFSPEDLALSTSVNKMGYQCWVNADVTLIHKEGMSGKSLSMIQTATRPAHAKGGIYFYAGNTTNGLGYHLLGIAYLLRSFSQFLVHRIKGSFKTKPNADYVLSIGDWNTCMTIMTKMSPKEIFIKYYSQLKYVQLNDDNKSFVS